MVDIHSLDESVGLLKRGTIVKYLPDTNILKVKLNNASAIKGTQNLPVDVPGPFPLFYNNGLCISSMPVEGTPVVVGQGSGGQYHFVSFLIENLSLLPVLNLGELLIQSNVRTNIILDTKNNISIGSDVNNIHINTGLNYISTNFNSQFEFTQASRKINGVVQRDIVYNTNFSQDNKLETDDYFSKFKIIGMDPSVTPNNISTGSNKNPPFIEDREITYEFQYGSSILDDISEATRYASSSTIKNAVFTYPNRRISRADTLSLSLVSPNYLIETVKGTIVDIFGNILDLNRYPLPIGQNQNTINPTQSTDKQKSFLLIKALERKSLAYHFELNARKDLTGTSASNVVNSSDDYSRLRSRFFFDIDKEGQFKLNVPASSETGNVALLARYENYSTFGTDDNGNPDKLVYRQDGIDIYQDSFASPSLSAVGSGFLPASDGSRGSISITDGNTPVAPKDRLTGTPLKHGMVYHDIMQTCFAHQNNQFITYGGPGEPGVPPIDISSIPILTNLASSSIIISGPNANAGGRSGSLNFDGSIEFNIGANTIDRQSLWMSAAGGAIINLGRDLNGRSLVAATGGDFLLQVGGFSVLGDSRFASADNSIKGAVLDLRILGSGGYCHMIRCDDTGITIMTPGKMQLHSKKAMVISSDTSIDMAAPFVNIQQRPVLQLPMTI